jgi:uncharacterized repeat protein (TIGR03803 family)
MNRIFATLPSVKAGLLVVGIAVMAIAARAQTYTALYTFSINSGNYSGVVPPGLMSQGRDGKLYSTLTNAGTPSKGTVFGMTLDGQLNTVYSFCSLASCTDGSVPEGGVTLGMDGNLYGTTANGGTANGGTVFKLNPNGKLATLWSFSETGTDEALPAFPVLPAQDGNFWGTDYGIYAGTYGVVYRVTPKGALTAFPFDYTDGATPNLPTQSTDGNFYGTTRGGGSKGLGVVYKLTSAGKIAVLHNFVGYPSDGNLPVGVLVQGSDGNFYGTTYTGGAHNLGCVFKITSSGTFTLLYSFAGGASDGSLPYTGLTLGTDGNLYGSAANGGKLNTGVLFKITNSGTLTVLYSFCSVSGCTDGFYPETPLVQHTNGKFYGSTSGNSLGGSVFYSLDVGLASFAKLVNWTGKVGKSVELLGQGFTGTTSVKFNGTAATFTVVSDTYLAATLPSGATSGYVSVVTPGGTLKSDRRFLAVPNILSFTPTSGAVGTPVTITGTSFTGAKKVAFGGVRATTFSVDSDTQITATVPNGALTGKIQVTTSGGTATSASVFTVTP